MRAGDHVKHGPTGETWVVSWAEGEHMSWSGWPEGQADVKDCTVIKECSDEEHEAALREWADTPHYRDHGGLDHRHLVCKRQLEEWLRNKAVAQ